jgi:hypothetical protein
MDQTQIQNKNKNNERSRGRMLELISRARSKDRAVSLECTLIGGVQPIWVVGPCRPRYKEQARGRGTNTQVDRRHFPLQHPDPILGSARPTGSSASDATSTTTIMSGTPVPGQSRKKPEGDRYPRRPSPPTVYASYSPLSPSVSLPLVVDQG